MHVFHSHLVPHRGLCAPGYRSLCRAAFGVGGAPVRCCVWSPCFRCFVCLGAKPGVADRDTPMTLSALSTSVSTAVAPWVAAVRGDPAFELMVCGWVAALLLSQRLVLLLARRPPLSPLKAEVLKRPTVVPVTVHSLVATISAMAVILPPGEPTLELQPWAVHLWRRGVLPLAARDRQQVEVHIHAFVEASDDGPVLQLGRDNQDAEETATA